VQSLNLVFKFWLATGIQLNQENFISLNQGPSRRVLFYLFATEQSLTISLSCQYNAHVQMEVGVVMITPRCKTLKSMKERLKEERERWEEILNLNPTPASQHDHMGYSFDCKFFPSEISCDSGRKFIKPYSKSCRARSKDGTYYYKLHAVSSCLFRALQRASHCPCSNTARPDDSCCDDACCYDSCSDSPSCNYPSCNHPRSNNSGCNDPQDHTDSHSESHPAITASSQAVSPTPCSPRSVALDFHVVTLTFTIFGPVMSQIT